MLEVRIRCDVNWIVKLTGFRSGWSLDSTFGIRLYTPNGVPGINSTNDWEENGDELHLLVNHM